MARQFTKPIDLYNAQKRRFETMKMTAQEGHKELADGGLADAKELTNGQPTGKSRLKLLREQHHPFARLSGNPSGRVRGQRGSLPYLPIGQISRKLHERMKIKKVSTKYTQSYAVGPRGVSYARFILSKKGTRKMVARGYSDEIKKRWKARNKAFIDHFSDKQKTS